MVLGLSLTSDDIVWVLVDQADGTVADHDSVEFHADSEIAGAAARGAHAIAAAGGIDIEKIRLTWSNDVARDGSRLRSRLSGLGFDKVEAVPLSCACAVMVDPGMEPGLALAYGAAVAEDGPDDAVTVPVTTRARPATSHRGRIALAVLGATAAAAVAGLLLTSGSLPHAEQTASAYAGETPPSATDPGWVAVSAPAESAGAMVRKVVEALDAENVAAAVPVPQPVPVQSEPVPEPVPDAEPVAVVEPVPVAVPHLPEGVPHVAALPAEPLVVPAAPAPEAIPTGEPHMPVAQPAVGPDMTVPKNLLTGMP